MNRIIKFRAWNTKSNEMFSAEEMAEDQLTLLTTGQFINVNSSSERLSVIYPLEIMIPMQFTGQNAKNGEVYEDDVIEVDGLIGNVVFEDSSWQVKVISVDPEKWIYSNKKADFVNFNLLNLKGWEIIGNIYQNPELLK